MESDQLEQMVDDLVGLLFCRLHTLPSCHVFKHLVSKIGAAVGTEQVLRRPLPNRRATAQAWRCRRGSQRQPDRPEGLAASWSIARCCAPCDGHHEMSEVGCQ